VRTLESEGISTSWIGPRNVDQIELDLLSKPKFKKKYKSKGRLDA